MTRGFVIMAQDTVNETTYIKCATALQSSIRTVMPDANITILTSEMLPYGDIVPDSKWKLANDWQVYEASPYDETIKLEADMFIPRSLDHWWDILGQQDVVVCQTIRNFKSEISSSRMYRKFIDSNMLPDVYNAITYFKKSDTASMFFEIVKNVFENWDSYAAVLKCNPREVATTDWAYAIACHIVGTEKTLMPAFTEMSMVHMKQFINGVSTDNWTDSLIYEFTDKKLRINTCPQLYPFHYHVKPFADTILENI